MAEFDRMCDTFGWKRRNRKRRAARENFMAALVQQFNALYGNEVDNLQSWQGLCRALDILPPPDSLTGAKKVIPCSLHGF